MFLCFNFSFFQSLESSAIDNSRSKRGQIGDELDEKGSEAPTIVLLHEQKPQRFGHLSYVFSGSLLTQLNAIVIFFVHSVNI